MGKKVLVGIPTSYHKEECLEQLSQHLKGLDYTHMEIVFSDNSKEDWYKAKIEKLGFKVLKGPWDESPIKRISKSRNLLILYAIRHNFDNILFLDSDVMIPKDSIQYLLSNEKDVVCGIYFNSIIENGNRVLIPGVYKLVPNSDKKTGLPSMQLISKQETFSGKLLEVVSCGGGLIMVSRTIFEKFRFDETKLQCEDRKFCIDLFMGKIPIYCDTRVIAKHIIKNRKFKWNNGNLEKNT
jgi:glycosyltransferase involved in cell wall biosynthesis